jgi:hypothetical protein
MRDLIRYIIKEEVLLLEQRKPPGYWTLERLKQEAEKYKTDQEFIKNSASAYQAAKAMGVLEIIFQNLERNSKRRASPNFWTKENVEKEASKYNRRIDFMNKSKGAYLKALEKGWLDDVTKNMIDSKTGKSNTEKFIQKAKKTHGDKYDYSKVVYTKSREPVIIICPEHGEFTQEAASHISGAGCFECGLKKRGDVNPLKKTKQDFLFAAKNLYGNKYDYSQIEYENTDTDIKIICPRHGEFFQTPYQHINMGQGCQKCGWEKSSLKQRSNTNEFIYRANIVHNNKFDYSKVNYETALIPVTIICPEHGEFNQRPADHLGGNGCPICKESKGERFVAQILDKNNIKFERQKKFKDCTNDKKGPACRKLPFDFYLPDYNSIIEFDGPQHYKPVSIFGGEEAFKKQQLLDMKKNEFCIKNGIRMIRIVHTISKGDIENYIKKELGITS